MVINKITKSFKKEADVAVPNKPVNSQNTKKQLAQKNGAKSGVKARLQGTPSQWS